MKTVHTTDWVPNSALVMTLFNTALKHVNTKTGYGKMFDRCFPLWFIINQPNLQINASVLKYDL